MKYLFLVSLLLTGFAVFGQKITGVVLDKSTGLAIPGATVRFKDKATQTKVTGLFEIQAKGLNDTLHISELGYKPFVVFITPENVSLRVELLPNTIALYGVDIHSTHSFKQDSLANRSDYAKQFNYTPPKLKDVVGFNPGSGTYQLLSINVLTLIDYLTYKSSPEYKFKRVLVRDEHEQYVDEKFNRGVVSRITDLKGDTLTTFLAQYRPAYQFVLKSTEYDMEVYIKDCYQKYKQEGFTVKGPFVKQD